MTDEVPEFQQFSITGSTANSRLLVMLLGSKRVPRSNGIPCLRRDRSGLTRVLDKSEATCIRQVEGYVLEVDVNEIGRSSSGNRAATQRHSHIRYEDAAEHLSELTAQSCTASRWRELNVFLNAVSFFPPQSAVSLCPVIQRSILTSFNV